MDFSKLNPKTKERDAFLEKQFKDGHFKEFNKLFKQEEASGMPGVVGGTIPAGKQPGKKKDPKKTRIRV